LKHHVIVPTLDSPLPEGKGALWCSSFLMAWKSNGGGRVGNDNADFARLNWAQVSEDDFPLSTVYSQAGQYNQELIDKIQSEMAVRFPNRPVPKLGDGGGGILAYAYLESAMRFEQAYLDNSQPCAFKSPNELWTSVKTFGISGGNSEQRRALQRQLKVVYSSLEENTGPAVAKECIVDLCSNSKSDQLLLARISRQDTLEAMLKDVEAKLKLNRSRPLYKNDKLFVPNLSLKTSHRFAELEKDAISFASQTIQYRLNRKGAELASEAEIVWKSEPPPEPGPVEYRFDQPFLLVMKKRGAPRPYFVAWITSTEFMDK
jgi:hypothetical protein